MITFKNKKRLIIKKKRKMKRIFLPIILIVVFFIIFIQLASVASAGTQHGVNGQVLNASDGEDANGAFVTFTISSIGCFLNDTVGVNGNSKVANWYAVDVGNCQQQWQAGNYVSISIVKDTEHTADAHVTLSDQGNDQAPTVNLSSASFCGDGNCTDYASGGNETCLNCPLDCAKKCVVNGICEICSLANSSYCSIDPLNQTLHGACEDYITCPLDCVCNPPDGKCDTKKGENSTNCPWDCSCGNAICEWWIPFNETSESCPLDCTCGNGVCDINETCETCSLDCTNCLCGNQICEPDSGENQFTCPIDCAAPCNGDGVCDMGETYATCPSDCPEFCGNMICDSDKGESDANCPGDCPPTVCGDGICEAQNGETWQNCPVDCYVGKCGDKQCLLAESAKNCCTDCGCQKGRKLLIVYLTNFKCSRNKCQEQINWLLLVIAAAVIALIIFAMILIKRSKKVHKIVEKKKKEELSKYY